MSAVEKFPILLSDAEEESSAVPPCFSDEGINVRIISLYQVVVIMADNTLNAVSVHKTQ
jgi:hypothetical protein